MKKKLLRRNKFNLTLILFFLAVSFLLNYCGAIDLSEKNNQFHLNMLTVNSIFLGFLFTGLGIMVGFTDKKSVKSLESAGYMDNYFNSIYIGLLFLITSTIISAIGAAISIEFIGPKINLLQQVSFVGGVLFFIKSIIGLMRLIKYIREESH